MTRMHAAASKKIPAKLMDDIVTVDVAVDTLAAVLTVGSGNVSIITSKFVQKSNKLNIR